MLNNLVLVGRVVENARIATLDNGQKVANVTLAVQRSFKNENDEYDTDFFPIQFWFATAEIVYEYCTKGSIIGVKGRLSSKVVEIQGIKTKTIDVIGERIAFIQMNKKEE